jgi:lysozyme family protein
MAIFEPIWKGTKGFEGGYQSLANDSANYCPAKGKPGSQLIGTNFGISAIALGDYFNRCPSVSEVKNLSPDLAKKIAKTEFWDDIQGDKIKSQAVAHLIFDSKYGSGSYGTLAAKQAINAILGTNTVKETKTEKLTDTEIELINKIPEKQFFKTLFDIRVKFFKGLTYEEGYLNRINKLLKMYETGLKSTKKFAMDNVGKIVFAAAAIGLGIGIIMYFRRNKN